MGIHLILIVFIVGLIGLTPVQPNQQTNRKAVANGVNDGGNIQGNFAHFFDSIKKNDAKRVGAYRSILEQEAVRGQLAFDTMKGELESARQKYIYKQRNSPAKDGNFVHFKRQTYDWAQKPGDADSKEIVSIPPEYCAYIDASIREWKMDGFIATVNEQYKDKFPKTQKACIETFNKLLTDCQFETELQVEMQRPLPRLSLSAPYPHPDDKPMSNRSSEKAGVIDVRTTAYTDTSLTPLVAKLRYDKQVCIPFSGLVSFLDLDMFNELYPKQKVILLALSFGRSGDSAIREWMALLYHDGKIVGAQKSNTDCLNRTDYADLKYKDKHLKDYFKTGSNRC